jgi:hypothetical protein
MLELERRSDCCGGGYPFELSGMGTVLRDRKDSSVKSSVYRYLLLSTRLNMQSARVHDDVDGTKVR